jgi:hypothetical protein
MHALLATTVQHPRFALALVIVITAAASGCASAPRVAERIEYDPPRWEPLPDLLEKARRHEDQTLSMIDEAGWLLYRVALPWSEPLAKNELYQRSHNIADIPAWHGYLMGALAFEMAVLTRDADAAHPNRHDDELARLDAELRRLASAFHYSYRVTGVPGAVTRALLPGYKGPRLEWMIDDDMEGTWKQSPHTGEWFRDDVNKDHFNLAAFGLGIPLSLDQRGEIELLESTRDGLVGALVPLVRRLVENDYVLRTAEGKRTPFPDLGPYSGLILPNGFHRMIALQALAAAAPHDNRLSQEYEKRLASWTDGLEFSMDLSGAWSKARGRWNRAANISDSDAQAFALASCAFLLHENRDPHASRAREALHGWWSFMKHERNAPFTLTYLAFVEDDPEQRRAQARGITEELRDFPPVKYVPNGRDQEKKLITTSGILQPIHNRPVDSNYWKASAYEQITATEEQTPNRYAGMDYLLAYWMGRYFDLIPAR